MEVCRKLRLALASRSSTSAAAGAVWSATPPNTSACEPGVTLSQAHSTSPARSANRHRRPRDGRTPRLPHLDGTDKIASVECTNTSASRTTGLLRRVYSLLRDRGLLLNHGITRRFKSAKTFRKTYPAQR